MSAPASSAATVPWHGGIADAAPAASGPVEIGGRANLPASPEATAPETATVEATAVESAPAETTLGIGRRKNGCDKGQRGNDPRDFERSVPHVTVLPTRLQA
ncbi:hypothetical protein WBP07_26445 [Novosphingobium sp. BL-8A]|uniref:hypothetical protein n=1 Tax=Novosphingobium sp. BL-8A TaxID=3127639 RepID=UPI003756C84A